MYDDSHSKQIHRGWLAESFLGIRWSETYSSSMEDGIFGFCGRGDAHYDEGRDSEVRIKEVT
jgi:hypothetical protein